MVDARFDSFDVQGEQMGPLGEWAYAPIVPTQVMGLTGGSDLEVVGESRYQEGIRRIVDKWREVDVVAEPLYGLLVAEPTNPFDRRAVRIDLVLDHEREVAGYLSREQAYIFSEIVIAAMDIAALPLMFALPFGGTEEKPSIGIWLRHVDESPDLPMVTDQLTEHMASRRVERARLNGR